MVGTVDVENLRVLHGRDALGVSDDHVSLLLKQDDVHVEVSGHVHILRDLFHLHTPLAQWIPALNH